MIKISFYRFHVSKLGQTSGMKTKHIGCQILSLKYEPIFSNLKNFVFEQLQMSNKNPVLIQYKYK